MKKTTISKIIFAILIIILIIMIIIAVFAGHSDKSKDLTLQMYNKICNNENYTFSMIDETSNISYELTVAKKGESMCIDVLSDGEHTATLVKDGYLYYIIHSDEEYYLYDSSDIDADILKNNLEGIENEEYVTGYENINGTKYYYEEYERNGNIYIIIGL